MKNNRINKELFTLSNMITLITITIFSAVLIVLNIIMNWEAWMIPVVAVGTAACIYIHISGRMSPRSRVYLYGCFLIFESFYYAVNISTVYDSSSIIVIMSFVFAMTGERVLVIAGVTGGIIGMGLHLLQKYLTGEATGTGGLILEPSYIVRVVWHFILIVIAAAIAEKMSSAWNSAEEKYNRRIDEVLKENESANDFLANVSHEIRTPVNAVIGLSSVMDMEGVPEQARSNMRAITEAGHRLAEQIDNIMDYTEIDTGKLSVTNETYMINSIVNDLISQLGYLHSSELDLVIDLSPEVPAELIGDGSKISKILRHLISNGFKFTLEGGVYVNITCKKRNYGVNLIIEVTDTGIGMSDEELNHIYDKFYQSDSGRSRAAGGLGLGIPIVNGFVRAMGGFLQIESTPGQGTLVRVSIPQEAPDSSPCISVGNKENILAAGFLSFMTTNEPRVREFYMEMIGHLVKGLDVEFHRVKTADELRELISSHNVTHLFVGTGEYVRNKEYIDSLTSEMNVVLVEDRDYTGVTGANIALLKKPFCGAQAANFLNYSRIDSAIDSGRMTCPGVKALTVDDEPMNLLVARGILESYGITVSTASGGAEALSMCANEDFDIIFMDHMMPGMDGVEAMKRLRTNAAKDRKELCIVALTANAASSAKEMFLSEGFDGFISKPIDLIELERVLKHVLPRSSIVYIDDDDAQEDNNTVGRQSASSAAEASARDASPSAGASPAVTSGTPAGNAGTQYGNGDPYDGLRALGVDIGVGMKYCMNDDSFYRELLKEYAKERARKLNELTEQFNSADWENYCIRVHAIKSTSKMIGAAKLSEDARTLEFAAKAKDAETIRARHSDFIVEYSKMLEAIVAVTGDTADDTDDDEVIEFPAEGSEDDNAVSEPVPGGDDEVFEFLPGGDSE